MIRSSQLGMRAILIILMALSSLAFSANSAFGEESGWAKVLDSVREDFDKSDCTSVWQKVWPHAASGNREALRLLALSIRLHGLTIPGELTDQTSADRHFQTLAVNGISNQNAEGFVEIIRVLIRQRFSSYAKHVAPSCFDSKSFSNECRFELLDAEFVPRLIDYVPYMERYLSAGKYRSECKLRER